MVISFARAVVLLNSEGALHQQQDNTAQHDTTEKEISEKLMKHSSIFLISKANSEWHASVDLRASTLHSSSNYTRSFPNFFSLKLDLVVNRLSTV
jgi:hypothetical protein